jgi:hypothetical protein
MLVPAESIEPDLHTTHDFPQAEDMLPEEAEPTLTSFSPTPVTVHRYPSPDHPQSPPIELACAVPGSLPGDSLAASKQVITCHRDRRR